MHCLTLHAVMPGSLPTDVSTVNSWLSIIQVFGILTEISKEITFLSKVTKKTKCSASVSTYHAEVPSAVISSITCPSSDMSLQRRLAESVIMLQ
jgi:hypothetical protein